MSGAGILRIKKLKRSGIITVAARHNKREIQAELGATGSIDPTRSCLNYSLAGPATAGDVGQLAKDLMTAAGITRLRKDAVMGLELVFSLPPAHTIDDQAYFTDCTAWAGRYFGGVILSSDVHKDESNEHCHVLILPLIASRMDGARMMGNKQKLMEMQKQFHTEVAGRYGLHKAPARLAGATKEAAAQAVLKRLRETRDKALESKLWATMRDLIENDPAPFLRELGIELQAPAKKLRTVAQIMTSVGKGGNKEPKPIDFAPPENRRCLCSVDFTPKAPPPAPAQHRHGNEIEVSKVVDAPFVEATTKHRESDQASDRYSHDTGDYCPARPPAPPRHRQAVNEALTALTSLSALARLRSA